MAEQPSERLAGAVLEELMQARGIDDLGELTERINETDPGLDEDDIKAFANSGYPFDPEASAKRACCASTNSECFGVCTRR